jgi:hypothetical protein
LSPSRQMPRASDALYRAIPQMRIDDAGAGSGAQHRTTCNDPVEMPGPLCVAPWRRRSWHEGMVGATGPAGPPRLPSEGEGVQDQGARKQCAQNQSKQPGNATLTHLSLPFKALVAGTIFSVQKSSRRAAERPQIRRRPRCRPLRQVVVRALAFRLKRRSQEALVTLAAEQEAPVLPQPLRSA